MSNLSILANLIYNWKQKKPNLDVLTFVSVDNRGEFVEEIRTYQRLWENGQRLACYLRAKGLRKGDRFAVVMANRPEFVDLMVASSILGTIFVPIDPRTNSEGLEFMLDFAECKGAFVEDSALKNVKEAWREVDTRWIVSMSCGDESLSKLLAEDLPAVDLDIQSIDPQAPMQMLYTSGTTGNPKAIISPHSRFSDGPSIGGLIGLTDTDRPYTGLSLTHANAQLITLSCILGMGLRGVISRKFTKSRLWDITRHYGCTWFNLLGGMTTAIYAEPPRNDDADNPVRLVLSAGMPSAIWSEFERRFDVKVTEFYGAAEGGLTFNIAGEGPLGSCGKPPNSLELKVFNAHGIECAPGEAGELCFRNADGSSPKVEYFKNTEASIDKTRGGWLRMGDIGHVDENGWLFFHYRKGGGIRKNGEFINPAPIEKFLSELDCVTDVFVYGAPAKSGVLGEKDIIATIVPKSKASFNAEAVFDECKKRLENNQLPSYIQIVDEIPKTASEKPLERVLLDVFDPEVCYRISQ